ncbi:MAG: DUF6364 family protein [Balneolaceae bacterium]|nr:DUF6364 family protein [Balneolaceae bacterium]
MKSKLTLRMEDSLIKRAKKRAAERGTSVSQMVADYFALIESKSSPGKSDLPPVTSSFAGILKDTELGEDDYRSHLEEKYLK